MIAEIFHNNISSIEEILEKFDIPLDIFSILLEEYKNARAKLGIEEKNYLELIQCKRQVLFHNFRQLIFHKKRQLIFHTYLDLYTHGRIRGLCYLCIIEMAILHLDTHLLTQNSCRILVHLNAYHTGGHSYVARILFLLLINSQTIPVVHSQNA